MIDHRIYSTLLVVAGLLWLLALPCIMIAKPGSSTFRLWLNRSDLMMVSALFLVGATGLARLLDWIWS